MIVRLGSVDPSDVEARLAAARVLELSGDAIGAAIRFRELHADLLEKNQPAEALAALREAVRLNPDDLEGRAELARAALRDRRSRDRAGVCSTRKRPPATRTLLLALADHRASLRPGTLDRTRELIRQLLTADATYQNRVVDLAWSLSNNAPEVAFVCIDATVDALTAIVGVRRRPRSCCSSSSPGFPARFPPCSSSSKSAWTAVSSRTMYETQAQLADAYLSTGQAAEARVIAEDLVAREPWEARAHRSVPPRAGDAAGCRIPTR